MIYELLEAESVEDLGAKVNQRLNDGWELYGNPVTAIQAETTEMRSTISFAVGAKIVMYQAVIKN